MWIDTETTGLDPSECELLEVALVVTDDELNEVDAASWAVLKIPEHVAALREGAHQVVRDMHIKNGLWEECSEGTLETTLPLADVEGELLARMRKWASPKASPMCGSTIAFDRGFLKKHMPLAEAHFSHRNLDASVFTEISLRWYRGAYEARPQVAGHRALPDIRGSIDLMKHWRATVLK